MNPRLLLPIVAMLCAALLAAKPAKAPSLPPGDIFFTMKGQPYALERTFPGITAAFMFTEEQKSALNEIYQETVGAPDIRDQGASLKKNGASDADRDAFRKLMDDARAELQKEAQKILTPEQKALIPKIQDAATEALREAREALAPEFTAAGKGNKDKTAELNQRVRVEAEDIFSQKLQKILTAAQMEAVRQAATQQREAEEQARKNKLGK
ncbi:MAG TPA: hypothetical protein VGP94_13305 [Tepidisphaeraceae bacterium]|nr:hypothetical protein [Tepidisphaeraceae bacterium]